MVSDPRPSRRLSFATRIAVLGVAVIVLTALAGGLIAGGLIRIDGANAGRHALSELADVAKSAGTGQGARTQVDRALRKANVRTGTVSAQGALTTDSQLVRDSVTPGDITRLRGGGNVSATRGSGDEARYVEARALGKGRGLVLVQARGDALKVEEDAIGRLELALVIAAAVGVLLWLVAARYLARLAAGRPEPAPEPRS